MKNNSSNGHRFHSSYVVDVSSEPAYKRVRLTDSARISWFVKTDSAAGAELKSWLKSVFFKGTPNTLTVFEYEDQGEGPDIENYVVRFINLPKADEKLLNG